MALRNGADPTTIVNDKSIGTLRNRSVSWINEAIRAINKPKLIQKAFALCTVPDTQFNLSYESLTSHEARRAIQELKTSNPEFHTEITAGRPVVLPSSEQDVEPEDGDSATDELSTADHVRIVMGSATATEAAAQQDAASQDSDDESTYEPPAPTYAGASDGSGSMPARREIPARAAKKNTFYTLQEWWNRVDIDD
ncbi:hypothetical protein RSOL_218080, partial [Rhizoctonia solani AG-3 Rhs1AP]